jgi:hypothetical protein
VRFVGKKTCDFHKMLQLNFVQNLNLPFSEHCQMAAIPAIDVEDQSNGSVQQHSTMTGGKLSICKECKTV